MKSFAWILLFLFFCPFANPAQKYIKYFMLDNDVRVYVEKSMDEIEDEAELREYFTETDIVKAFVRKWGDVRFSITKRSTNQDVMKNQLSQLTLSDIPDYVELTKNEVKVINRNKVGVLEFTDDRYHLMFVTFYGQNQFLLFHFHCPVKTMEKWKPIAWDMLQSLEVM